MEDRVIYTKSGERIKKRREELGLTLEDVGSKMGVNKSTIKRYEDGTTKRITVATYEKLAKVLETTSLYLMGVDVDDELGNGKLILNQTPMTFTSFHQIPILGVVRAGQPICANQDIIGHTYIDKNDFENYFALKVMGDSMDLANIKENSVVVVRKQDYIENGEIAVVLVDNEDATIKRVYINNDSATLVPQSSNPENKPIFVDLKERNFKILGRVIKVEYYV